MTTTDDLLLRFGRIVRERRDYLGLRQDQVAARGGPSTTTLTKVENGTPPAPTPGTLRKLDVGLGWEQGSATRAVSGGDPTPTHENAIKTEFFSATGKRLGSTIWIEGAEQEFLEQLRMAELTLDAADLVAGESGPLMTAIGAMLIEASILATRAVARGASGGDSSSAEVERAMELIEGIRKERRLRRVGDLYALRPLGNDDDGNQQSIFTRREVEEPAAPDANAEGALDTQATGGDAEHDGASEDNA